MRKICLFKNTSALRNSFTFCLSPHLGREAKENIIFFVALRSTLLSAGLAEGPMGLRRLAAATRGSIGALVAIFAMPTILSRPFSFAAAVAHTKATPAGYAPACSSRS